MKNNIETLKKEYYPGLRVKLISMDDLQAPKPGTLGTVVAVDDIGNILVKWDNGSSLNLIPGEDKFMVIEVTTICYNRKEEWTSRIEALKFFITAALYSEGSEHERYEKIIYELKAGFKECTDQ